MSEPSEEKTSLGSGVRKIGRMNIKSFRRTNTGPDQSSETSADEKPQNSSESPQETPQVNAPQSLQSSNNLTDIDEKRTDPNNNDNNNNNINNNNNNNNLNTNNESVEDASKKGVAVKCDTVSQKVETDSQENNSNNNGNNSTQQKADSVKSSTDNTADNNPQAPPDSLGYTNTVEDFQGPAPTGQQTPNNFQILSRLSLKKSGTIDNTPPESFGYTNNVELDPPKKRVTFEETPPVSQIESFENLNGYSNNVELEEEQTKDTNPASQDKFTHLQMRSSSEANERPKDDSPLLFHQSPISGTSETSFGNLSGSSSSHKKLTLSFSGSMTHGNVMKDAFSTSKDILEKKFNQTLTYNYRENSTWNDKFQEIIKMTTKSPRDELDRAVALRNLSKEFISTATRIGKEIIEERKLDPTQRVYQPKNNTQLVGAEKYIEKGILFKFAIDLIGIYGDDEFAMKAASHELAGANELLKVILELQLSEIFVPLMCLIDYRGYRLIASAVVPVIGKQTLVYGSCDAGSTIVNTDPGMSELMEKIGNRLKLKGHYAGQDHKFLHFGGDIEGHIGRDAKMYILDTCRVLPPEALTKTTLFIPLDDHEPVEELSPFQELSQDEFSHHLEDLLACTKHEIDTVVTPVGKVFFHKNGSPNRRANIATGADSIRGNAILIRALRSAFLHKLLRPELVASNPTPLSSDAFTGFESLQDPNRSEHQAEVHEATQRLLKKVIPNFAKELNYHAVNLVDHKDLIKQMHRRGINVRYLGILRAWITIPHLKSFVLTEMIVRVCKNYLRRCMRELPDSDEEAYNKLGLEFFNSILGSNEGIFWNDYLKVTLQVKFPSALSEKERLPGTSLRDEILLFPLFTRLQEVTGFHFKAGAQKNLFEYPLFFMKDCPLVFGDIDGIGCLTKTMISDDEVMKAITRSVTSEEEESSLLIFKKLDDKEIQSAYNVLLYLKQHRRIERILGADSSEAIKSYFDLASEYKALGRTDLALDCGLRGLSYGEVLFGDYSEETLMGLVTVGEIMESFSSTDMKQRAVGFYKRALTAVDRLYRSHPLKGKLGCKLHFLEEELSTDYSEQYSSTYLQKGFDAYSQMYGEESATLVVPLLALENNVFEFVNNMVTQTEKDQSTNLVLMAKSFWPEHVYSSVKTAKAKKDIIDIVERLKNTNAFDLLFGDSNEKNDLETLMELSQNEIADIMQLKSGIFTKLYPAVQRYSQVQGEHTFESELELDDLPADLQITKDLWRSHGMPFPDFVAHQMRIQQRATPTIVRKDSHVASGPIEHKARLRHRMDEFQLRRATNVPLNLDSQFAAVSFQLMGNFSRTDDLRRIACRWLRENRHYEICVGTSLSSLIERTRWDSYCSQIENHETPGDMLTLIALAEKFGLKVYLISSQEGSRFVTQFTPRYFPRPSQRPVFISHHCSFFWGLCCPASVLEFRPLDFRSSDEPLSMRDRVHMVEEELRRSMMNPNNFPHSSSTFHSSQTAVASPTPYRLEQLSRANTSDENLRTSQDRNLMSSANLTRSQIGTDRPPSEPSSGGSSLKRKTGLRISKFHAGSRISHN